jgi:hypothetical protein
MSHFGNDYCALDFYLDSLDVVLPLVRKALAEIEPPVTPRKIKEAMSRVTAEAYPRIAVERDPDDPNRLVVLVPANMRSVVEEIRKVSDAHDVG